jgi:hypothetical protein
MLIRRGVMLELARNTKVAKYNMAIRIDENVLWFDISVNDVMSVDMFYGKKLNSRVRNIDDGGRFGRTSSAT